MLLQLEHEDHDSLLIAFRGRLTLTVEEAYVEHAGLSRGSAYEGCRTGRLPCVRVNRRILVPTATFLHWLGLNDDDVRVALGLVKDDEVNLVEESA